MVVRRDNQSVTTTSDQTSSCTRLPYRAVLQRGVCRSRCRGNRSLTPDNWSQVPLLTRESLQEHGDELLSRSIPKEHGQTFEKKTSGSTGRQIVVTDTEGNRLFWQANTLRDHLWHQRNFRGHLAAIRSGRSAKDPLLVKDHQSWGNSTGQIYETGPSTVFYQRMPIWKQAEVQLVQDEPDHIELRIVAEQPLNETHESSLTAGLGRALGQPYRFSVRYQHETLRLANGKYERFICQV